MLAQLKTSWVRVTYNDLMDDMATGMLVQIHHGGNVQTWHDCTVCLLHRNCFHNFSATCR